MKLAQDICDVYGQRIALKGSTIDRTFLNNLTKKGFCLSRATVSLGNAFMLKDFERSLRDPRYHRLFLAPSVRARLIRTFSRVKLIEPVFLELHRMKSDLPDAYHHVLTMSALVIKMIHDMKSSGYDPVLAASLCLTHDIGKTRIPKAILYKKTRLTGRQFRIIQTHPLIGYLLLRYYHGRNGRRYCETAFEHHEKLDGSGYPRGITSVDPYAQLIAPVDIYDALISKRPYRKMSYNGRLAIDILLEDAQHKKLSKKNVYLLINCIREQKADSLNRFTASQRRRTAPPRGNTYGKIKKETARRLLRQD